MSTTSTTTPLNGDKLPYPTLDLGPMGGTSEQIYEMSLTLVEIFTKLCGLEELELRDAHFGHTDCATFVAANFNDPEAYLTIEHELSHIFFDSDLALGEEFRKQLVEELLQKAGFKLTSTEMAPYRQTLEQFIHHIWNCLEDHRVRSLWEEIYPGGGWFLGERWKNVAEHCMEEAAEKDLLTYIARTAAIGKDTPGAPEVFKLCKVHIDNARSIVDRTDKKTCLAITKQLVDNIANTLLDWAKQNNKPVPQNKHGRGGNSDDYEQDLLKHAKQVKMVPDNATDFGNTPQIRKDGLSKIVQMTGACNSTEGIGAGDPQYNPMGGKDVLPHQLKRVTASDIKQVKQISKMATLAAKGNEKAQKELEKLIEKGTSQMKRKIRMAKAELARGVKTDPEQSDKVEFLNAAKAAGIKAIVIDKPTPLPPASSGSNRVQGELEKIRMMKKTKLYEEGDDIDIEAFISAKINGELEEAKVFKSTTKEAGLELLILSDCSGSMYGAGIDMVDQAMSDIRHATKNLKVDTKLWAFSNSLYVFTKPGSLAGVGGGGTDLIPALDAALEWARQSKANRGIIMLTDGYPTSCRRRNSTGNPRRDMYNVIKEAQQENIVISILCINEHVQEYIECPSCKKDAFWLMPDSPSVKCSHCGTTVAYENRSKAYYDDWFGKGNYSVVTDKKDIRKQLPLCARALVINHMNKHM